MAKISIEELCYGDKYGIMSGVFQELVEILKSQPKLKCGHKALELIICKHTLLVAEKMKNEGDYVSDEEMQSPSLYEEV